MNVYKKEAEQPARACVIWMHGLGADAQDMAGLAEQLPVNIPVRHVFMNAPVRPVTLNNNMPMRAWYNISGVNLTDRDDIKGILQSEQLIREVIDEQVADGFASEQIFLAGFSQGGAMALFSGFRTPTPLAGIIALSSYIPARNECKTTQEKSTPIFMASGQYDSMVLPEWSKQSARWVQDQGYANLCWNEYLMEHSICKEEIIDLAKWLTTQVSAISAGGVS